MLRPRWVGSMLLIASGGLSCAGNDRAKDGLDGGQEPSRGESAWQTVHVDLPGALMSVWGRGPDDVWAVGSDTGDGKGALLLHYDGSGWQRHVLGLEADIWWVHGFEDGRTFFGGSAGSVLLLEDGHFRQLPTPGTGGTATVFGVWGASSSDVWAVGGDTLAGTRAIVWRYDGDTFRAVDVPGSDDVASYFKVWGTAPDAVWIVGTEGTVLSYDGRGWSQVTTGARDPFFTVHANPRSTPRVAAVGGYDLAIAVEQVDDPDSWRSVALPSAARQLFGVWLTDTGGYAVGDQAAVYTIDAGGWARLPAELATNKALHAVWVDGDGGVWAVGGDVLSPPLGAGVLVHFGPELPTEITEVEGRLVVVDGGPPQTGDDAGSPGGDADAALPDAGPGTGGPPDAADGGPDLPPPPPRVAGAIRCGDDACTVGSEVCCFDRLWTEAPQCYPIPDAGLDYACPQGSGRFPAACDQNADCAAGDVCCLTVFFQGGAVRRTECASSCVTHDLCDTAGECNGGGCVELSFAPEFDQCF